MAHRAGLAVAVCLGTFLIPGCGSDADEPRPEASADANQVAPEELEVAVSETREDSYYPEVGDPGVDALHYDLALDWDPEELELTATEVLTFRATRTADEFQLDFGEPLEVSELSVDGDPVDHEQDGKDLVVDHAVEEGERYEVEIAYSGSPEPVEAPGERTDFSHLGWTITDDGGTWTMQEPYGAYSWYAVNDHPSDKALYDFTLTVPSPWSGVANGQLVQRTEVDGVTTTGWHLAEPASSYLITAAFGDYELTEDESASGVPITYWTPRSDPETLTSLQVTPEAMAWLEDILGPYPFDTFGTVVVDSQSGMETQTMVTLGDTDYTLSPEVIVHELAHQWYGDQVTPSDWRDVWMNEGMVMYLQGMWEAEQEGISIDRKMNDWRSFDQDFRDEDGPPAAYHADSFGGPNIYYNPAVMFHELRTMVGDKKFFAMVRGWPRSKDNETAGREDFFAYMEKSTGEELTAFFDAWLLGERTPPRR